MNTSLTCCFVGHRNTVLTESEETKLKQMIKDLIIHYNVSTFLFGSCSTYDSICHSIVTDLKKEFYYIKRVAYTCKSETCTLESERERLEKVYSTFFKKEIKLMGVEEEKMHKNIFTAGKASYVERNQEMIDDSDICVFYYDENYKPDVRRIAKKSIGFYQPKSGTRLAYFYAIQKKKKIINLKDMDEK